MDKNMISIDDLLKQRLSGGEEKERPGAWLAMRDLLDQQMPNTVATGYNWRKMFGYMAGLLLLATASVGGYRMYTSRMDNKIVADNAANLGQIAATVNSHKAVAGNNNTPFTNTTSTNNTSLNTSDKNLNNADNQSNNNNNKNRVVASAGVSKDKQAKTENNRVPATLSPVVADKMQKTGTKRNNSGEISATNNSIANGTDRNNSKGDLNNNSESNKLNNNKLGSNTGYVASTEKAADKVTLQQPEPVKPQQNTWASGNTVNSNQNNTNKINTPAISATGNNGNSNGSGRDMTGNNNTPTKEGIVKQQPANPKNPVMDSIDKIETREKYTRGGRVSRDTIAMGKVAYATPASAADNTVVTNTENTIMPSAGLTASADKKEGELLPLSQFKQSSKKGQSWTTSPSAFEEMVKNAQVSLGKINFHAGILFGVNSSIAGINSLAGIQAGLVGMMNISDHWSLFTELKYMQRFNSGGNVVADNYNTKLNTVISGPQQINTWDSVMHSFKYSTLSSIHLPVAVKYAYNRLSIFCGADFAYNFTVNNEEVSYSYGVTQVSSVNSSELRYYQTKTSPGITSNDFGARMEIGAMAGLGYSLSPAVQLDFRAVQSLWDNAKTTGAVRVSDQLYNKPSLQLNFTYRFSSNKYRPYRSH